VFEDNGHSKIPSRLVGRPFGRQSLECIRQEIDSASGRNRAEIARRVSRRLGWINRGGQLALMSTRVALLRLHNLGLIQLPPPRNSNGNQTPYRPDPRSLSPAGQIDCSLNQLQPLVWQLVSTKDQSKLWNDLIDRHHYRGHSNLPGAQLRYLIYGNNHLLAAIGFGAAAWQVAARDRWIGWDGGQRRRSLDLVLNNARFLIPAWVRVKNLASHILGGLAGRLPTDFQQRYGWRPVLLETFVEPPYCGGCYRAANWRYVGLTAGRGKKGGHAVEGETPVPVKQVWVYPLSRDFRDPLCAREGAG
jgi:hypothetical protein